MATRLISMSVQLLYPVCQEVHIVPEEENGPEPAPLASMKVFDYPFEQLNSPANVYIH